MCLSMFIKSLNSSPLARVLQHNPQNVMFNISFFNTFYANFLLTIWKLISCQVRIHTILNISEFKRFLISDDKDLATKVKIHHKRSSRKSLLFISRIQKAHP